ncbi:hypothetical protein ACFX13_000378 [Malus domestica]
MRQHNRTSPSFLSTAVRKRAASSYMDATDRNGVPKNLKCPPSLSALFLHVGFDAEAVGGDELLGARGKEMNEGNRVGIGTKNRVGEIGPP